MAVTWSYAGSTSIQVIVDTVAGHSYIFSVTDGTTLQFDTFSGSGSPMTRTITGLSGLTAGDPFGGKVQDDTTDDFLSCNNFIYGTASNGHPISASWTYDGASTITITFAGTASVSYNLQANYYSGGTAYEEYGTPFTATGSTQAVSLTTANTPALNFVASLWLNQDTFTSPGSYLFPAGAPFPSIVPDGRVLVAWDDGPLEPNPTWTPLDQASDGFPAQFVAGYDIKVGRQTLLSQTDTGTATVYINDHESALFDDRNLSSPYQGKLSGRQIMLQLYDPVAEVWEPQFRGIINDYSYAIDGSASDANGDPINASIQIEAVDMFDYLEGFGLTPGLAGVTPPVGAEDGVYYAATTGTVDDRIIEILTDAGIDSTRYLVASGNTKVIAVKYDPGESALTALRDAADAEFPFIANIYVDRHGNFAFRGRYSRFNPDDTAAEPGSDWDFTRWAVGDEKAIQADPTRAQMRVLSFSRSRSELINVAGCWPQGLPAADMPDQYFADTSSITAYGQHSAPPMSDLLTADYAGPPTMSPSDGKAQCFLFAKLLVKNQAFPREAITSLQVKAIAPDDYRAAETWSFITQSDISHIVNVMVGYPGGTGFVGDSPRDDYYIEGRSLTVRPLNPVHDYVEYNVEVSPAVWSMDTHSVFPPFPS
jgi:hypothetical protein